VKETRRTEKACKTCEESGRRDFVDRLLDAGASDRSAARSAASKALKLSRLDVAKHRGHLAEKATMKEDEHEERI